MAEKYPAELKLKAIGMIHEGVPLKEITSELKIPYPTLLRWRTELKEGIENGSLTALINVEEAVVHEVADQIAEDLIKLDPSQAEAIEGELLSVTDEVDGYKVLSTELQRVASKLAKKISAAADQSCGPIELESLVGSLSKLQEAFFNKNVTQIAVFPGGESSATAVNKFKGLQKA